MKKLLALPILVCALVLASIVMVSAVQPIELVKENHGNPGSIWTTRDDCGDEQQNINQYDIGENVYINGRNFNEDDYDWEIKGQPGQASCNPNIVVASGTETVGSSGAFCFDAYTVENDNCGVYQVKFGKKGDNYHVIPEFGLFVGSLTILAAVGIFFFVRKK